MSLLVKQDTLALQAQTNIQQILFFLGSSSFQLQSIIEDTNKKIDQLQQQNISQQELARQIGLWLVVITKRAKQQCQQDLLKDVELDISQGKRSFLTKEDAQQLLQPLLEGKPIQKVKFSTKSFGVDAAHIACQGLEKISQTLEVADLSDIIAGRPEEEALKSLNIMSEGLSKCNLKELNVSDNAFGEKGLRALKDTFKTQVSLQILKLENIGASVHACMALEELLPQNLDLRELHLCNNMSGDEGAQAIARLINRCNQLYFFKMVSSRVGHIGFNAILSNLSTNIVSLNISDNPITEKCAKQLAKLISNSKKLKVLNLNDTMIEDQGLEVICEALQHPDAPKLEELCLALNSITPQGCKSLAFALSNQQDLQKLDMNENELEDNGAMIVAAVLLQGHKNLRQLYLNANQINGQGALLAAQCVTSKSQFELLELDENSLPQILIANVKDMLSKAFGSDKCLGSLENNEDIDDDSALDNEQNIQKISKIQLEKQHIEHDDILKLIKQIESLNI